MRVIDIMTPEPAACTPETPLKEVAHLMIENDCGAIPVVENFETRKPVGVITDRDITVNTVAFGKNPLTMTAAEIMSFPVEFVTLDASVDDCCNLMEKDKLRRMLVIDDKEALRGIVAQADIALAAPNKKTAELVKDVSMAHTAG